MNTQHMAVLGAWLCALSGNVASAQHNMVDVDAADAQMPVNCIESMLYGDWGLVFFEQEGMRLEIANNPRWRFWRGGYYMTRGNTSQDALYFRYSLNVDCTPMRMRIRYSGETPLEEDIYNKDILAIVRIEGDLMSMSYNVGGNAYPGGFEVDGDTTQYVKRMRRLVGTSP